MELTDEQFSLIKEQFKTLKERSPFYAKKFEGIDLSDVQTQEDFEKLPFSEKADLREAYPLGLACLLYTSPSPRDGATSRMPSSA